MKKIILFSVLTLVTTQTIYAYTITLQSGDIIQCHVIGKNDQNIISGSGRNTIQSKYLNDLAEIEGNSSVYYQEAESPPQDDQIDLQQAIDFIVQGDLDGAELLLKNLINTIPEGWKPRTKSRGLLSVAYWDFKEYRDSLACEKNILGGPNKIYRIGPSYSSAYYWLSNIEIARNNPKKALEYLDRAESLESDHPLIFFNRGYIYNRMGLYLEGYKEFEKSLNVRQCIFAKQEAEAYRGMGVAYIGLKKFHEARDAFNKSLEFDPINKMAFNELEYIKHLMNMYVQE